MFQKTESFFENIKEEKENDKEKGKKGRGYCNLI